MKSFTLFLTMLMLLLSSLSYSQAGTLDSNFGNNGKVMRPAGFANAVAIAPDGKIIAGGHTAAGFTLVRYGIGGTLDKTFGINGVAVADFGDNDDAGISAIVIKPSGKIIAAGTDGKDFAIAKFNANGTLDSSFGKNGKVTTDFVKHRDEAKFVTVDDNNRIIAVGSAFDVSGEAPAMAVVRYKPDGTLDSSFDHDGKLKFRTPYSGFSDGHAMILQPDGKMVVVGNAYASSGTGIYDFMLVRLRPNGTVDKTFGSSGGYTVTDFNEQFDIGVSAGKQSDGKIVVAGYSTTLSDGSFTMDLARYSKDGILDSAFGINGKIIVPFSGEHEAGAGLAIQSDDKIIVTGAGSGIAVTRFTKDGLFDSSFGGNGTVNIDSTSDEVVRPVVLQKNGKIIAAGSSSGKFLICRLKNDVVKSIATANEISSVSKADVTVSNIRLHPNPSNDIIYIENIPKGSTLTIYNEHGNAMMQTVPCNETQTLNIQRLPAGVYFVQFTTEGKVVGQLKFVKQN